MTRWRRRTYARRLSRARQALLRALSAPAERLADHLGEHVAHCPRCRRRLRNMGRLRLAMTLLKTQTCPFDMLQKANATALEMLQRPIRTAPGAEAVRTAQPPRPRIRLALQRHTCSTLAAAACLAVLALARMGLLHTIDTAQRRGQSAVRDRYLAQLGPEWTDRTLGS